MKTLPNLMLRLHVNAASSHWPMPLIRES